MAQEVWVIAGVVVLVALQFVVYRFLRRWTDTPTSPNNANRHNTERLPSHAIPGDQHTESGTLPDDDQRLEAGIQCPTCGALNGSDFTFCRRCTNRLGG